MPMQRLRKGQIWRDNKTGYDYTIVGHCYRWWYLQLGGSPDQAPFGLKRADIIQGFTRVGREKKKPLYCILSTTGEYEEVYA